MFKIFYIVSSLKRSGPTNQLFNIIKNLDRNVFIPYLITLSSESKDSRWSDFETLSIHLSTLKLSRIEGFFLAKHKLASLIKTEAPDLIHTQGIRADSLLASFSFSIPWFLTARNYPYDDYPMKFGKFKGFFMAMQHISTQKKCLNVVACSKSIQFQLKGAGVQSVAIQNGINLPVNQFEIASKAEFESPVFVTVGSLIPRKNTLLLVESFNYWKSQTKSPGSLVILGDGVERKELEDMSGNSVHFLGNVNNVADYLAISNFFVSASLSEGLPNTVLEALASGLPVILSDIPSHMEIFEVCSGSCRVFKLADGVKGLVDEFNKVHTCFDDVSGLDATRVAKDIFSAGVMSKKYQTLYLNVLENK